jgi:hypothetical protein
MSSMTADGNKPAPAKWAGWHRPGRRTRWLRVVEGTDEDAVRTALHAKRSGGDFYVGPVGTDPNRRAILQ